MIYLNPINPLILKSKNPTPNPTSEEGAMIYLNPINPVNPQILDILIQTIFLILLKSD